MPTLQTAQTLQKAGQENCHTLRTTRQALRQTHLPMHTGARTRRQEIHPSSMRTGHTPPKKQAVQKVYATKRLQKRMAQRSTKRNQTHRRHCCILQNHSRTKHTTTTHQTLHPSAAEGKDKSTHTHTAGVLKGSIYIKKRAREARRKTKNKNIHQRQ